MPQLAADRLPGWLAGLALAAVIVLIAALARVQPGRLARRCLGAFILMLIPAGCRPTSTTGPFLHAWNPHHAILPVNHAWHPAALQDYPALLASLTIAAAALISALILTSW